MPLRFDYTVPAGQLVALLVAMAIALGVLAALQSSHSVSELIVKQEQQATKIQSMQREIDGIRLSTENFQAEQRNHFLSLSNTLKDIQLEQVKKGPRK